MTKTIALGMLLCLLAWHRCAEAQTSDHLRIDVEGSSIGPDGGEQPNTSMSTGPIVIGKTTSAGFAKLPSMCGLAVASTLQPGATFGWNVDVIPRKVDGDAVTFRVRWVRSRDEGKDSSSPAGDLEWTLRPGESLPLDVVPLAPAGTMAPESCKVRAMSVRIAVKFWPRTEEDCRLVVTDLWLIRPAAWRRRTQPGADGPRPLQSPDRVLLRHRDRGRGVARLVRRVPCGRRRQFDGHEARDPKPAHPERPVVHHPARWRHDARAAGGVCDSAQARRSGGCGVASSERERFGRVRQSHLLHPGPEPAGAVIV